LDECKSSRREDLKIPAGKTLIVTVGYVNQNKRIDKIIEVLGENQELSDKILYAVVGSTGHNSEYFSYLQSLVTKYGLSDSVRFLGFQPNDVLYNYMAHAEVFINLRYPAMESASWSLIEQLYFEKPVIVINTGFYGELPDTSVVKVGAENEKESLRASLERLLADERLREKIGKDGKKFVLENCNAEQYCRKFMEFAEMTRKAKPVIELIDIASLQLSQMEFQRIWK